MPIDAEKLIDLVCSPDSPARYAELAGWLLGTLDRAMADGGQLTPHAMDTLRSAMAEHEA